VIHENSPFLAENPLILLSLTHPLKRQTPNSGEEWVRQTVSIKFRQHHVKEFQIKQKDIFSDP
jgi:hypothetical protein